MKSLIILIFAFGSIFTGISQTAVNFNCNDCDGVNHDLFTDLDNGKVVVICWVMPCASCIPPSKTAYNVAMSYESSHPGRVLFYLADDLGSTPCNYINSWANTNDILASATSFRFSDPSIDMNDYGTPGMPKIVVIGCNTHHVFYNLNTTVSDKALQNAIDTALNCSSGIKDSKGKTSEVKIYQSHTGNELTVDFTAISNAQLKINFYNIYGSIIPAATIIEKYFQGSNSITIGTGMLKKGMYILDIVLEDKSFVRKIVIP